MSDQVIPDSPRLNVADVAERYAVSEKAVYGWVRKKLLRATKVGGALRFRPSDLDAFERGGQNMPRQPRRAA